MSTNEPTWLSMQEVLAIDSAEWDSMRLAELEAWTVYGDQLRLEMLAGKISDPGAEARARRTARAFDRVHGCRNQAAWLHRKR